MQFEIEELDQNSVNNGVIIKLTINALDYSNVGECKQNILASIKAKKIVIIDMGSLNFLDSSGLGMLLSMLRNVKKDNGDLKLFGLTRPVQALIELVRMHRVFAIYNNRDEALASI